MKDTGRLPLSGEELLSIEEMSKRLEESIGEKFELTGKMRTDGIRLQKFIARKFEPSSGKEETGEENNMFVAEKGNPSVPSQLLYVYLARPPYSGLTYNLQMWNVDFRELDRPLVENAAGGTVFRLKDARIAIVSIDRESQKFCNVLFLTPQEMLDRFNPSGVRSTKKQAIIPAGFREMLEEKSSEGVWVGASRGSKNDLENHRKIKESNTDRLFMRLPSKSSLLSLKFIGSKLTSLLGTELQESDVRRMSLEAERLVIRELGYRLDDRAALSARLPDLPHQLLEVKVQKRNVISLGEFTPFEKAELMMPSFTTEDMRYCLILTDEDNVIEHIALMNGVQFKKQFSLVKKDSFKTQCRIQLS